MSFLVLAVYTIDVSVERAARDRSNSGTRLSHSTARRARAARGPAHDAPAYQVDRGAATLQGLAPGREPRRCMLGGPLADSRPSNEVGFGGSCALDPSMRMCCRGWFPPEKRRS